MKNDLLKSQSDLELIHSVEFKPRSGIISHHVAVYIREMHGGNVGVQPNNTKKTNQKNALYETCSPSIGG